MRIVCISDTHELYEGLSVPDGDLLIHAGDSSVAGSAEEIIRLNNWLGTLPHAHKIIIAGNHDFLFETDPDLARSFVTNAHYLEDSAVEIDGLSFWGSPITPWYYDWAFNRRDAELRTAWSGIPSEIDVLITHGPPFGILDKTRAGEHVGCGHLLRELERVQPRLHVFGHIHESYGRMERDGTVFINASNLDHAYRLAHAPLVVDLEEFRR